MLNKDKLLSQMELFSDKFTELKNSLRDGDTDKMREMMRISTERRKFFDK